jgi:hypothetical protein
MRLTRYLYPAHRVCMTLEHELVHSRNKHRAMYWAFELLHSGLLGDLLDTLWMVYRSKFQEVHPAFENYMKKTLKPIHAARDKAEWLFKNDKKKLTTVKHAVRSIVRNLLIRSPIVEGKEKPPLGKKVFVTTSGIDEEVDKYNTRERLDTPISFPDKPFACHQAYKILGTVADLQHLGEYGATKKELHIIRQDWERFAFSTPIWTERFTQFKAVNNTKSVDFPDDDQLEGFYEEYGLDPDEWGLRDTHGRVE